MISLTVAHGTLRRAADDGRVTVGKAGRGADVLIGEHDEPGLSATAAVIIPRQAKGNDSPPPRWEWYLHITNRHHLRVRVAYKEMDRQTYLNFGAWELLLGNCDLTFHLQHSGEVTVRVRLDEWDRPDLPKPDVVRSGTTLDAVELTAVQRIRAQAVFLTSPDGPPTRRLPSKQAAAQVGTDPKNVEKALALARGKLPSQVAEQVGVNDLDHGVALWLYGLLTDDG